MKNIQSLRSYTQIDGNGNLSVTLDLVVPKFKGFKFSHLGYPKMDQYFIGLHTLLYKDSIEICPSTASFASPMFGLIYTLIPQFKESSFKEHVTYYSVSEFTNLPEGTEGYIIDKALERMSPFVLRNGNLYHKNNGDLMILTLYKEFFVTKLGE
jgi:hypothetical protein